MKRRAANDGQDTQKRSECRTDGKMQMTDGKEPAIHMNAL